MKRCLFIGMVLLLALASCTPTTREARRMVRRAERLADTLPDSTLRLIDSVLRMEAYFSERERMELAMLQGDLLFGHHDTSAGSIPPLMDDEYFDDKPFFSTSPELERAAAYFARKKQYDRAATAALYSGFVQQHYGEKTHAMQSFKDAERFGEMAKDSLIVARAQYKIGKLLYDDDMEKEAIISLKRAEKGFDKQYTEKALTENLIAICYTIQGNYDSSEFFLNKSLWNAENADCLKVKGKTLNNLAVLYRLQGKHELALNCLRQAIDKSNHSKMFLNYLNMGKVFVASGALDSALYYYQRIDDIIPIVDVKKETLISAYGALSLFAESQNDNAQALKYRKTHENLLYEAMSQRQKQVAFRIQKQYDYENIQNILNRKILLRHRIIMVISILLFISAAIIIFLQFKHKQMREAEVELQRQIDTMKEDLRQTVKSSVMDEEITLRLKMMLTASRTTKHTKDPKKEWQPLVSQVMNGKENLFEAIRATIEKVYPDLYSVLMEKYPNLTETEAKICMLSFCDISNAEAAELLDLRLNTVNQNRSTLRKKLNLSSDKMKEQLRNVFSYRV